MAIRLEKGQRINLEKSNGSKLENICVGVNWGAIKKKNWLGFTTTEAVDFGCKLRPVRCKWKCY